MKRYTFLVFFLAVILTACTGGGENETVDTVEVTVLKVGEKTYTLDELEALPQTESTFNDVTYLGVTLTDLLEDAGIDASALVAVKAIAVDGYSKNYESDIFMRSDVVLAYAQADGPLTEDDGTFRMVLPGEEGNMNVRQVVEIQAVS